MLRVSRLLAERPFLLPSKYGHCPKCVLRLSHRSTLARLALLLPFKGIALTSLALGVYVGHKSNNANRASASASLRYSGKN